MKTKSKRKTETAMSNVRSKKKIDTAMFDARSKRKAETAMSTVKSMVKFAVLRAIRLTPGPAGFDGHPRTCPTTVPINYRVTTRISW